MDCNCLKTLQVSDLTHIAAKSFIHKLHLDKKNFDCSYFHSNFFKKISFFKKLRFKIVYSIFFPDFQETESDLDILNFLEIVELIEKTFIVDLQFI